MKQKIILKFLLIAGVIGLLARWGCPIFKITGIECPACGSTRAWLFFFQGKFAQAFSSHAFFLLIPLLIFAYAVKETLPIRHTKKVDALLGICAGVILVYHIIRLIV